METLDETLIKLMFHLLASTQVKNKKSSSILMSFAFLEYELNQPRKAANPFAIVGLGEVDI